MTTTRKTLTRQDVGRWGEEVVAAVLAARGWTVLDRNWRPARGTGAPRGELDLVCDDGRGPIVCEVKTRSTQDFGHPFEAIGPDKAARLRALARRWCEEHAVGPAVRVRIDAVAVTGSPEGFRLEHLRAVA